MFRFLYSILLSLFFTSCSVKSNLIQDEFYILEEDFTFQSMSAASSVILGRQSNGEVT